MTFTTRSTECSFLEVKNATTLSAVTVTDTLTVTTAVNSADGPLTVNSEILTFNHSSQSAHGTLRGRAAAIVLLYSCPDAPVLLFP